MEGGSTYIIAQILKFKVVNLYRMRAWKKMEGVVMLI